jgi:hypothetical protein
MQTAFCRMRRRAMHSWKAGLTLHQLPNGKHLDTSDVLTLLLNAELPLPQQILYSSKDNVYMLIDNSRNGERRATGKKLQFHDDRGAWDSAKNTMPRVPYARDAEGHWRRVSVESARYCMERSPSRRI